MGEGARGVRTGDAGSRVWPGGRTPEEGGSAHETGPAAAVVGGARASGGLLGWVRGRAAGCVAGELRGRAGAAGGGGWDARRGMSMHLYRSDTDPVAVEEKAVAAERAAKGAKKKESKWRPLELEERDFVRGKAATRLRKAGRIPVVLMGKQLAPEKPINCSADLALFTQLYRTHGMYHMLALNFLAKVRPSEAGKELLRSSGATEAEVAADVATYQTIVHSVAWDPLSGNPIHIELMVLGPRQPVVARPIQLIPTNVDQSVAKRSGCELTWNQYYLKLLCKPDEVPRFIEVDVGNLRAGQTLFFDRLKLPPGVLGAAQPWKLKRRTPICRWRVPRAAPEEEVDEGASK